MSASEFKEHLQYWADDVKIDRYRRALEEVITPGATVLDLGSGTGLLGLLACEAGAGKVYAVENGPIASVAAAVFEHNGVADRVQVIRAKSTEVTLPEDVDVVVGDQIGGFAYSAGVLRYYRDATDRLLKPSGTTIPASFELFLAPVEHPDSRKAIDGFAEHTAGFDLAPIHTLVTHTIRAAHLTSEALLSPPVSVRSVAASDARRFEVHARLEVSRAGDLHGVAGFFRARMSPSVHMSNLPDDPDAMRFRWQDLFPIFRSRRVHPGDVIVVDLLINPQSFVASWTVSIDRGNGPEEIERHSSFEGDLIDPQRFRSLTGQPLQRTQLGLAALHAVAAAGEQLDVDALTSEVADLHPDLPRAEVERVVRGVALAAGRH